MRSITRRVTATRRVHARRARRLPPGLFRERQEAPLVVPLSGRFRAMPGGVPQSEPASGLFAVQYVGARPTTRVPAIESDDDCQGLITVRRSRNIVRQGDIDEKRARGRPVGLLSCGMRAIPRSTATSGAASATSRTAAGGRFTGRAADYIRGADLAGTMGCRPCALLRPARRRGRRSGRGRHVLLRLLGCKSRYPRHRCESDRREH
jgi:hypothetical protein